MFLEQTSALVINSKFEDLSCLEGPAIFASKDTQSQANINIEIINSTFLGNTAINRGGSIFLSNVNALVKNSNLTNNQALQGEGGALILSCSKLNVQGCNNTFT